MTSPEQSFDALLRANPSRPFVTYYDEAIGERMELSAKSLANWVAKTHHLLGDTLGLGPGDRALLAVSAHWCAVPAMLGCLTAGLELVTAGAAEVAFVMPDRADEAGAVAEVFTLVDDYAAAVRPQPDIWAGVQFAAGPDDPCLPGLTRAETVARARERAAELGLSSGARVLSVRDWSGPADWIDTLLAPLAVGGSVVYLTGTDDPAVVERRAGQERVTNRA